LSRAGWWNSAVLEMLREHGAKATFFLAGKQVEKRPALAAEIVAAGHRVELTATATATSCA
jgi:peptidoglycan/xylan/chitin deacetylase (PgdA/CDA1 family)